LVLHALTAAVAHDRYVAATDRAVVELHAAPASIRCPTRARRRRRSPRATGALHASARMAEGDALPLIARGGSARDMPPDRWC
jgi:hypothetical protein